MNLNIKLLLFLIFPVLVWAQEEQDNSPNNIEEIATTLRQNGTLDVNFYYPIAIGKSFISEAATLNPGVLINTKAHLYKNIYTGGHLYFYSGDIVDQETAGLYNDFRVFGSGINLGYRFNFNKLSIFAMARGSYVRYSNSGSQDSKFIDDGIGITLAPEITYNFAQNFNLAAGFELKRDFMNIESSVAQEELFKNVDYFNLFLGVQIWF